MAIKLGLDVLGLGLTLFCAKPEPYQPISTSVSQQVVSWMVKSSLYSVPMCFFKCLKRVFLGFLTMYVIFYILVFYFHVVFVGTDVMYFILFYLQTTVSESSLFDHLINIWEFNPGPIPGTCDIHFLVDFKFQSPLYRQVMFFSEFFVVILVHL